MPIARPLDPPARRSPARATASSGMTAGVPRLLDLEEPAASLAPDRTPTPLSVTRRQAEALAFIAVFIAVRGYSPSYAEICAGLGMSPRSKGAAHALVHQLADRGALVLGKGRANSIALTARIA